MTDRPYIDVRGPHPQLVHGMHVVSLESMPRSIYVSVWEATTARAVVSPLERPDITFTVQL